MQIYWVKDIATVDGVSAVYPQSHFKNQIQIKLNAKTLHIGSQAKKTKNPKEQAEITQF